MNTVLKMMLTGLNTIISINFKRNISRHEIFQNIKSKK